MKTVHEVSRLAGVSVRTLHHYDAIGLLKPAALTQSGYRLYDDADLSRLQTILLFRELQFPLAQIAAILDSPGFDPRQALRQQIDLLQLQRARLDELIALARELERTGVGNMDFSAFDKTQLEQYAAEAKAAWGQTAAYQEFEQKPAGQSSRAAADAAEGLMQLLAVFGTMQQQPPDAPTAQAQVQKLQAYITEHFYACTPEILRGLGQMYTADSRMQANIDKAGGAGTAAFASRAIAAYCG